MLGTPKLKKQSEYSQKVANKKLKPFQCQLNMNELIKNALIENIYIIQGIDITSIHECK